MSYDQPTPPADAPDGLIERLEAQSPEVLRGISRYAQELAEYREREARLEDDDDEPAVEDGPDEVSDDVPSKASLTVKEINDNRYYYWQWREGDRIRSQYEGPVSPDE